MVNVWLWLKVSGWLLNGLDLFTSKVVPGVEYKSPNVIPRCQMLATTLYSRIVV